MASKGVGKALKRAREDAGLKQRIAAKQIGVSRATLSRMENNPNPKITVEVQQKMQEVYGLNPLELVGGVRSRPEAPASESRRNAAQSPQPGRIGGELGPGYVRGLRDGLQRAQEAIRILQLGLTETEQASEEELAPARSAAHLRAVVEEAAVATPDAQAQSERSQAGVSRK